MSDKPGLFHPLKSTRAFEAVSDHIKELIFNGDLNPGDKLPSEIELSRQFNVGRQTTREALRLLEMQGFITIQTGGRGGPVVQDMLHRTMRNLSLDVFRLRKVSIDELVTARLEMESVVLRYAIDNRDDGDIAVLTENVKAAQEKVENNIMATEDNVRFHKLLARATKNHVFVMIMECIMAVHGALLGEIAADLDTSRQVVEDHRKILALVIARDHEQAADLFKLHLLDVGKRLKTFETEKQNRKS